MRKAVGVAAVALTAVVLSLSSCSRDLANDSAERIIERAAARNGENVDVEISDDQMSVSDAQGNVISFGAVSVPTGWPGIVPVHSRIEIGYSGSSTSGGKKVWNVTGGYDGSARELYDFYKKELADWTAESDVVSDLAEEVSYAVSFSNDEYQVALVISGEEKDPMVILAVTEL